MRIPAEEGMNWLTSACHRCPWDRQRLGRHCTRSRLFVAATVLFLIVILYSRGSAVISSALIQAHLIYWRGPGYNFLHNVSATSLSVYVHYTEAVSAFYGRECFRNMTEVASSQHCNLPLGGKCVFENENPKADVMVKVARCTGLFASPLRYCPTQILAVMNTESEASNRWHDLEAMRAADVRIDHHPSSDITLTEACTIPWKPQLYTPPNPSERKGVALLMSNCGSRWRNNYIHELFEHIHIYSYGKCFHNTKMKESRDHYSDTYKSIAEKHRMVISFENVIESDYITEKVGLSYRSGVIPVYWGPPEIYQWVPGNHSFIDPQKFKGPKELAEYLKRVDEDDDLFRYHTTKFTFASTERMHKRNCIDFDISRPVVESYCIQWPCQLCRLGQRMKLARQVTDGGGMKSITSEC